MPRNQGTSRKGKPKKNERAAGMGRALAKAQQQRYRPKMNGASRGLGGMTMTPGVTSIGVEEDTTQRVSVLEMDDLADFLGQAEMAHREFVSEREQFVTLDETATPVRLGETRVKWADQESAPNFVFHELSVPRRPSWDESTTPEELDLKEKESFLEWRRAIAAREEALAETNARVTPFEKNLEIWRQLWRVLERCSVILQLVDARNPLFYLSSDLRTYAVEELGKPMVLLINKSDYLSRHQRHEWHLYFEQQGWDHLFFSAHIEQEKLDRQAEQYRKKENSHPLKEDNQENDDDQVDDLDEEDEESPENDDDEHDAPEEGPEHDPRSVHSYSSSQDNVGVESPLTRQELLDWMHNFADQYQCQPDPKYDGRVPFATVGFPNVGKSSVINVLMGNSKHTHGIVRVGVASQPGKTKHFQTLLLPDRHDIMLCDCPGLVFPSFVSSTADLIAAGVYPIAQMRDHWPVVELICQRIPREILNAHYGIQLPMSKDLGNRAIVAPPTAEELLTTYCAARSLFAASSGVPDYPRAARVVIQDFAVGKLLYCHSPPTADANEFRRETLRHALSRTRKLQDKLGSVLEKQPTVTVQGDDANAVEEFDDLDILEVMEGLGDDDDDDLTGKGGTRGKKHKTMKKWGKKGRKDRNKDPYGCHSNPDVMPDQAGASSGVIVNAGKYGRKGYTRPTNYAGARGVNQSDNGEKVEKLVL